MNKEQLLIMLKELFQNGDIKIEFTDNKTFIVIDSEWIRVDVE